LHHKNIIIGNIFEQDFNKNFDTTQFYFNKIPLANESALREFNMDLITEDLFPASLRGIAQNFNNDVCNLYDPDCYIFNKPNDASTSPTDVRTHSTDYHGSSKFSQKQNGKINQRFILLN